MRRPSGLLISLIIVTFFGVLGYFVQPTPPPDPAQRATPAAMHVTPTAPLVLDHVQMERGIRSEAEAATFPAGLEFDTYRFFAQVPTESGYEFRRWPESYPAEVVANAEARAWTTSRLEAHAEGDGIGACTALAGLKETVGSGALIQYLPAFQRTITSAEAGVLQRLND